MDRTGKDAIIGIDIGSTTVKTVLADAQSRAFLWSRYDAHETYQARTAHRQLTALFAEHPELDPDHMRVFVTGSGGAPLASVLGAKFVQEVNAITFAAEALHDDVGSAVELGGQDAKIIVYKPNPRTGERQIVTSMNDKCASGTGTTIDKCLARLDVPREMVREVVWQSHALHHVAAKCGVFAETDIVNLMKAGIDRDEIVCSLADAIVMQNLSVLARGNTLRHKVLLLGGPNTYLPVLQAAWRQRIAESWGQRGYAYPADQPLEELIAVPDNAALYPAFGAAIFGHGQAAEIGRFRGLEALAAHIDKGREAQLIGQTDGPLADSAQDLEAFRARYAIPPFVPPPIKAGATVAAYVGIDGGSTSSKAVLMAPDGTILAKQYRLSKGNPIADAQALVAGLDADITARGGVLEVAGLGVTGYAGDILEHALSADVNLVETIAHHLAAKAFFDKVDVICDVGGQDIKVLFLVNGEVRNFRLSNQCSAGNGMLLQAMAAQFGVAMEDYAETAFSAALAPRFSYGCAVFLDADRVNFQREGFAREEIMAGLVKVLPKNIWQYVVQIPRLAELGRHFVLQGGTQYNLAAVKAQVDYIKDRVPGAEVQVHPVCGEAGALGAAIEAQRVVSRQGESQFIGRRRTAELVYTTKNDAETVCRFCTNFCQRTFVSVKTPDGRDIRHIAGHSCENGTVASKAELKSIAARRKRLQRAFPNFVDNEVTAAFFEPKTVAPLPASGTSRAGMAVKRTMLGAVRRKPVSEPFARSPDVNAKRRANIRIGIPRVLAMFGTGPFWRAYFETLGLAHKNIVFSEETGSEMWLTGGKYGSVDPCFPAKVAQAHIHQLLAMNAVPKTRLDYVFMPALSHVPSFLEFTKDAASCPIVSGNPAVQRASFTKDVDFFARAGVEFVDPVLSLIEPNYLKAQLFGAWGERLGITRHENSFAVDAGFAALAAFDAGLQADARTALEALERTGRLGILLLARPYHNDVGLNHGVLADFQALGYPIFSIRSIPKDAGWLARFFADDLDMGRIASVFDIRDVWPEAYSTNSGEKVWAAKFAARHPNLAVLDISSFKCGHDAPTYGLIDNIVTAARTPYMALHDLDANRPGGSLGIRVRTFAHTLRAHEERLALANGLAGAPTAALDAMDAAQ